MGRNYGSRSKRGITPHNDSKGNNIETYREQGKPYIKEDEDIIYGQALELFYEDEQKEYYFNCLKSSHVWLVFPVYEKSTIGDKIISIDDTIKVLVGDALRISLTTIDELEKLGLEFITKEKTIDNKVLKKRYKR